MERDDVRAVFFDAGYTLLCMDPPQEILFLQVCSDLGIAIDDARLGQAVRDANALLAPRTPASAHRPYSLERVDRFWIEYHRVVLQGCAVDATAVGLAEPVYRTFSKRLGWRVYDDVRPLLDGLRARGIKLGVISNWTGDLEDVLHRIDLRASFDFVIDSAHFGHEKPHPEIFAEALRLADVRASAALHVGDSVEHDVDGALSSGLRPVLVDRTGRFAALHVGDSVEHDVDGALSSGLRSVLVDRSGRFAAFDRAPRVANLSEIETLL